MKIELHCHTAPRSSCAESTPDELLGVYAAAGYRVVFFTDHNAVWPDGDLETLQARHPDVRIFPGVERSVGRSGKVHLLILGTNDPNFLDSDDVSILLTKARNGGFMTVLAHPFIAVESVEILSGGMLPDAIEYRTGSQNARYAKLAKDASADIKLPLLNSGDVHHTTDIGKFWIETDEPVTTIDNLRDIVIRGGYRNCLKE